MWHRLFLGIKIITLTVCLSVSWGEQARAASAKSGDFLNPISDVAWGELFPFKIAGVTVAAGGSFDAPDPANATICICPLPLPPYYRTGVPMSYWDPNRIVEVVKTPYYFPFLGEMMEEEEDGELFGSVGTNAKDDHGGMLQQTHYFIFPLMVIMDMLVDTLCTESSSGLDLAYISELDPTQQNDELAIYLNPEALLFSNPIAQLACIADAVASNLKFPLSPLFWCMGSSGSAYPLSGHVNEQEIAQAALSNGSRTIYKMARLFLLCDPAINYCSCTPFPIWMKHNYKFQVARPGVRKYGFPIGVTEMYYSEGLNPPVKGQYGPADEFLWILFRKRACCVF